MVLAFGISIPDSIIFVDIKISDLPSEKVFIALSSSSIFIWPCATTIEKSGTIFWIVSNNLSISLILGHTIKVWPPRFFSLRRASTKTTLSHSKTKVLTANLSTGGVAIKLKFFNPDKDNCKVLGIGVAVKVKTWILPCNSFIFSFCPTPKCCSSSIINKPKLLKSTSFDNRACVPTTIFMSPDFKPAFIFTRSLLFVILDKPETFNDVLLNLLIKLWICCFTKIVVGATKATW